MLITNYINAGTTYLTKSFPFELVEGQPVLILETTVSAGRENVSTSRNFVTFFGILGLTYNSMRNELIGLLTGWATMSTDNKKAMVENFVYPVTETAANLNLLYTQAQRDTFKKETMKQLNSEPDNLFSVLQDKVNGNYYKLVTENGAANPLPITTDTAL